MSTLIREPGQITPEWLTDVLKRAGHLPEGQVTDVRVASGPSFTSTVAHLTVTYSLQAAPEAPTRLFLKIANLDSEQKVVGREQRRQEVEFHIKVAAVMPCPPVVRCYDAVYCDQTSASHLLFQDASGTHFQTEWPLPPSKAHCERAVDSFAKFHAFWWDHPRLVDMDELPTPESSARYVASVRECFSCFAGFLGDRLSAARRRLYDRVLQALPELRRRVTQGKDLSLIHGDANFWNVLLPKDTDAGEALIIDWQLWNVSFAAEDLSNLIALQWYPERRGKMEQGLVKRYYEGLLSHGVQDYEWADCWYDYRLAVMIRVLFMPMWQWSSGQAAVSWWSSLERAILAFEDLGCDELLNGIIP